MNEGIRTRNISEGLVPELDMAASPRNSGNTSSMSYSSSVMTVKDSCVSSKAQDHTAALPEIIMRAMPLVGCPRCLMFVMLSDKDPKCPKCNTTVFLDLFNEGNTTDNNKPHN